MVLVQNCMKKECGLTTFLIFAVILTWVYELSAQTSENNTLGYFSWMDEVSISLQESTALYTALFLAEAFFAQPKNAFFCTILNIMISGQRIFKLTCKKYFFSYRGSFFLQALGKKTLVGRPVLFYLNVD